MMKRVLGILLAVCFVLMPLSAMADVNLGDVISASKDINIVMFGSLKTLPHFIENADFNSDDTSHDRILDENGFMENHSVRNEFRIGWKAKGENWDFMAILESDFVLNKPNGDRGADATSPLDSGMTGEDFGVEKLNFSYDFGPFKINTGWNTKFLDLMTGGILYGDDHPYIGLAGKLGEAKWELLYLMIQDDIDSSSGFRDGDSLDWRAYTLRVAFDLDGFTLAPMYAFSDNEDHGADVHYLGVEGYGKIGKLIPRFEIVYAVGEQDVGGTDYDISAWGAFGSVEAALSKALNPFVGFYYLSGDDDDTDEDIDAFNGITNISRYSKTFGMENAIIYRYLTALGTHLYSNNFNTLGSASGYGGISNSSKADAPGMIMIGAGSKGALSDQLSYKAMIMYFMFESEDNLPNVVDPGTSVDDEVGLEIDFQLTYTFNKHFSLGNVLAVFVPGDGVTDRLGSDYDETAIVDTIELTWKF